MDGNLNRIKPPGGTPAYNLTVKTSSVITLLLASANSAAALQISFETISIWLFAVPENHGSERDHLLDCCNILTWSSEYFLRLQYYIYARRKCLFMLSPTTGPFNFPGRSGFLILEITNCIRSISPALSLDMGPIFPGGGSPLLSGPYDTISMKRVRQPTGGESHENDGSIGPLQVPAVSFQGPCKSDNQSTLASGEGREWVYSQ